MYQINKVTNRIKPLEKKDSLNWAFMSAKIYKNGWPMNLWHLVKSC